MTSRYLFLDIDGVLHPADAGFQFGNVNAPLQELQAAGLFANLSLMDSLLEPHPDVRLIIHSSWRLTHSDDELRQLLGPLAVRVDGVTERELDRYLSIREYVGRLRLGPAQYRVLDDQPELLDGLADVVIACDPIHGLADAAAQRQLIGWLYTGTHDGNDRTA